MNSTLEVGSLCNPEDFVFYKQLVNKINADNPFYKTELFRTGEAYESLNYFLYFRDGEPLIIMNFYLKAITFPEDKITYFDVITPYGYSGPLLKIVDSEILTDFWQKVDQWYKNHNVVSEFIRFSLNGNHQNYSGTCIPTLKNIKGHILNEELQWEQFKPKVRNNFRKAQKANLEFEIVENNISESIIDAFYKIYIDTMQRNSATRQYYFKREYFASFIRQNPDHAAIAIVYYEKIPISSEFILKEGETLFSYLGGTISEYFHVRPNDFLKLGVLDWARKADFKYYVLGGGRSDGDGLYEYKKAFFPKDEEVCYYTGRKVIDEHVYKNLASRVNPEIDLNSYSVEELERIDDFFPIYRKINAS